MAVADLTSAEVEAYLRRRTGVRPAATGGGWLQRLAGSTWTWVSLGLVVIYTVSLWVLVADLSASQTLEDGTEIPGLNGDALWLAASRAWPTMLFWVVCFILVDRYKPQRLVSWLIALGWGACAAVTISYYVNSWVGLQMAVVDPTSGLSSVRVAVFVAPFVEEASKACIIFFLAVLARNRFTSLVSGAVVGGLAGAGFAFTENIIYYSRVIVYGSYTSGTGDVMAYLDNLVWMRGVLTSFGHPLFTMMTGLAVAWSVTSRSKVVRVIGPGVGFLFAAFLHMFFNWWASVLTDEQMTPFFFIVVWLVVASVALRLVLASVRQGRLVAARLGDYVTMGWLPASYPEAFSRLRTRAWTMLMSLWHGNPRRTWRLQTSVTRLAMLRNQITRGTVDQAGLWRERELIEEIARLANAGGLVSGRGLRPYWPWKFWRRWRRGGAGRIADQRNATAGSQMKYSAVNPRWGPPK